MNSLKTSFEWDDAFDETYFENGTKTGVSLYQNYEWKPELSFPMACELKIMYPNQSILDFGCAKGFLVHALRLLNVEAYGFEVSRYAVSKAPQEVMPFIYTPDNQLPRVDVIFIKDTLEHINENQIQNVLNELRHLCTRMFVIVPFGDQSRYRIREYEKDLTHMIRRNEAWWKAKFDCARMEVEKFSYRVRGFKDNWHKYKYGNGFFQLAKQSDKGW
jgi:SAM-dependent methyltransferase